MPDANKRFYAEIWPHAPALLRAAQFLTRNEAEADDLAQEVMLKAFRHLDQLVDPSGAKAWLMTILRTTRLDRIRAAGKAAKDISLNELVADPPANESQVPDPVWDEPEALLEELSDRQIIDALKKLPEDIRWTLLLVDIEGVDQAEAAEILQVPVGTIKSRASRGRSMLRVALTPLAKDLRMTR